MSDAIPLPPRPDLDQYKRLARELQRACAASEPGAVHSWAASWLERLARLWAVGANDDVPRRIGIEAERMAARWRAARERDPDEACTLARAQRFVAREHGFASWPALARHVREIARERSPLARYERAADAIVDGDLAALERHVREDPALVHARSSRAHRSTLLHYVSANGIEDFRQRTPRNVVEIARRLLDAGADVNAESDAYAGRSTVLGLTATSCHPANAGVQLELLELLLARGAAVDGPDGGSSVVGALRNGQGKSAELFARYGARLDLEGAAGVGRVDLVESFVAPDGGLRSGATERQRIDGFAWACQFGRAEVVELLLCRGVAIDASLPHHGQTGLHWAAYGWHPGTVALLLDRGAPVHAKDPTFGGTALGWAVHALGDGGATSEERARLAEVIRTLTRAGARVDAPWFENDADRRRALERARTDPLVGAALAAIADAP